MKELVNKLKEIIKKYPNDYELGKYFYNSHHLLNISESHKSNILRKYPNFYDLGAYLRNDFIKENYK